MSDDGIPGGRSFKRYFGGHSDDGSGGPGSEGPPLDFYRHKPVSDDLNRVTRGRTGISDKYEVKGGGGQ